MSERDFALPLDSGSVFRLISWFEKNAVSYPWGDDPSPYRVWISEVMLQQTVVTAAVEHFKRWIVRFPDTEALAEAGEQEVLKAWEGLGYYSRARNLHKGAVYLMQNRKGSLPESYEELVKVPGIGDYTARAILSLAFQKAYPVLDANVRRIGQRLSACAEWPARSDRSLLAALEKIIPSDSPGQFNSALMQLGQQICRTGNPRCSHCPLAENCLARASGLAEEIPRKKVRPVKEKHTVLFVLLKENALLLYRRSKGIGKGLWFLPGADAAEAPTVRERIDPIVKEAGSLPAATHLYTTWKDHLCIELYEVNSGTDVPCSVFPLGRGELFEWVDLKRLEEYPAASVYRKILNRASEMFMRF